MKEKIANLLKKRVTKVIIVVLVAFIIINIAEIIISSKTTSRNEEWGLKMTTSNVSSTGLSLIMERENSERSEKLSPAGIYRLYKRTVFGWKPLGLKEGKRIDVIGTNAPIANGESQTLEQDWEDEFGKLGPGVYRISKEFVINDKWETSLKEVIKNPELRDRIGETPVLYATFVVF